TGQADTGETEGSVQAEAGSARRSGRADAEEAEDATRDDAERSGQADTGETEGSVQAEAGSARRSGRADAEEAENATQADAERSGQADTGAGADAGQAGTATAAGARQADAGEAEGSVQVEAGSVGRSGRAGTRTTGDTGTTDTGNPESAARADAGKAGDATRRDAERFGQADAGKTADATKRSPRKAGDGAQADSGKARDAAQAGAGEPGDGKTGLGESEGADTGDGGLRGGDTGAGAEVGTGVSSDAAGSADEAAAPGDARLRDVVAAWVSSADEEPEDGPRDAVETPQRGAETEGGAEAADADDAAAAATSDTGTAGTKAGSGIPDKTAPTDDANAEPTSGAKAGPKADAGADSDAETGPEAKTDSDRATDTPKAAATDADAKTPGTAKAAADPKVSNDPRVSGSGAARTPKAKADHTPDSPDTPTEKPRVDQPTAVFKAPRPSAPAVDQPTTMLKLGDAGKAAEADKKGKPGTADTADKADTAGKPNAESPAERTSKFVALKPLDEPSTRKPKADPEGTSAIPQVGPERTTQQPLPPKPPLDLLAELTNTPPPPDTPVRTIVRRVKIWTPLVLLLAVVFAIVQAVRPLPTPSLELTAKDSYSFEGSKLDVPWPADGQAALDVQGIGTFGSSGAQKPVPIASVAKVMTAYLVLRDHPLKSGAAGPKIKIDQAAQDQSDAGQESTVNVTAGDSISQREALESILIASANNVARLLARWDAGSEKAFVAKMNDAADDLGMSNTTYTDPSGLNNTTVSTAVDQVKLAKAAMKEPAFREVAAMMSYDDYKGVNHSNWNHLVGSNNVVGIKTGTTTSALGNLVFAAKKEVGGETRTIVGAVVRQPAGGPDNTILGAALDAGDKLIRAAQGALESATILKKGDVVGYVDDGLGGQTPVVTTKDVTAVGWEGLTVKLTFAANDLPHTAKAGTQVGSLTVGDGSGSAVKVPVALQRDLVEPGFSDKLTRLG
ncbi:D-alanyl-D-alanine carboxypeptidase, partial [Streptomyces sp. NPDC050619]|uniref:D-alanyl-D-alanine carboxypeptidase n=1 Tax=Streptomyces sp. NPDC050619 TaxID=3157214 RepID=UPI0034407671